MSAYTDADERAVVDALLDAHLTGVHAAKAVLDAVAPAIAARALRDAADAMHKADATPPFSTGWLAAELALLARANHVERTP